MTNLTAWLLGSTKTCHAHLQTLAGPGGRAIEARVWDERLKVDSHGTAYGVLSGAMNARAATLAAGFRWLYCDGSYWLSQRKLAFRLVWDDFWFRGQYGPVREGNLDAAGCTIEPWSQGDEIFVCPNTEGFYKNGFVRPRYGTEPYMTRDEWVESTVALLELHTDRTIRVRKKVLSPIPAERMKSMLECFRNAWAIVTSGSTIGVEAVCRGVPVFTTQRCAASPVALSDLSCIEDPWMPDEDERRVWAKDLAARQFSVKQIQHGEAWRICEEDLAHGTR